jgi:uncharacterized protein YndB with AHSA1/START domain
MKRQIQIAPVRKSIVVNATPQRAFEVFGQGIDRWWPKNMGIGNGPIRESKIEPRVGGRWYTVHEDGSQVTVGHVRVWEPGARMAFAWEISGRWKPDARIELASEVDVVFVAEGEGRTRVDLEHRQFERMGTEDGQKMRDSVDGGWPGLLELFAQEIGRTQ